jgi:hypothetical protein
LKSANEWIKKDWTKIFSIFDPMEKYCHFLVIFFQGTDATAFEYLERKQNRLIELLTGNAEVQMARFVPGAKNVSYGVFDKGYIIGL